MPPRWAVQPEKGGLYAAGYYKCRNHGLGRCGHFRDLCRNGLHPRLPGLVKREKDGSRVCIPCRRENARQRRERYIEAQAIRRAAYYRKNREKVIQTNLAWRQKNWTRVLDVERLRKLRLIENPTEAQVQRMIQLARKYPRRKPVAQV